MYNKKGGKVLGQGRDGCVTDETIMCSTNLNKDDYKDKVSKVIDITNADPRDIEMFVNEFKSGDIFRNFDKNGNHFLPGLEMCYKKFHELNQQQKSDMAGYCQYDYDPYKSLYLNIILKKGISFQKITQKLKTQDFYKSLLYLLIGVKKCVRDLKCLLLDIKGDNLLYKEEQKDVVVPVFIDFSNDFVIKNKDDLSMFIRRFGSYYNTWSLEMFILFTMVRDEKSETVKKLYKDLNMYRGIELKKLLKNDKELKKLKNGLLTRIAKGTASNKEYNNFCEKQMIYAIAASFHNSYFKSSKQTDLRKNGVNNILTRFTAELYYDRPSLDVCINMIVFELKNKFNYEIKTRKDYFIDLRKKSPPKKSTPKSYVNKDLLNLLNKTSSKNSKFVNKNSKIVSVPSSKGWRSKPITTPSNPMLDSSNSNNSIVIDSLLQKIDSMIEKDKKKILSKSKKSKKINNKKDYNLPSKKTEDIVKQYTKKHLIEKVKEYKRKKCNFKSHHLMKKAELIDSIIQLNPNHNKDGLKNLSYFDLKNGFKIIYDDYCKINQNASKKTLVKFLKKQNVKI